MERGRHRYHQLSASVGFHALRWRSRLSCPTVLSLVSRLPYLILSSVLRFYQLMASY